MGKPRSRVSTQRANTEVVVFKNGEVKKVLKSYDEGKHYLSRKLHKKEQSGDDDKKRSPREKRKCTPAQLEALARGRKRAAENREKNKSLGVKPDRKKKERPRKEGEGRYYRDDKVKNSRTKDKKRVRREKEEERGRYRSEDEYTSSSGDDGSKPGASSSGSED